MGYVYSGTGHEYITMSSGETRTKTFIFPFCLIEGVLIYPQDGGPLVVGIELYIDVQSHLTDWGSGYYQTVTLSAQLVENLVILAQQTSRRKPKRLRLDKYKPQWDRKGDVENKANVDSPRNCPKPSILDYGAMPDLTPCWSGL